MYRLLPAVSSLTLVTSPVLMESIGVADSTAPCEYSEISIRANVDRFQDRLTLF